MILVCVGFFSKFKKVNFQKAVSTKTGSLKISYKDNELPRNPSPQLAKHFGCFLIVWGVMVLSLQFSFLNLCRAGNKSNMNLCIFYMRRENISSDDLRN